MKILIYKNKIVIMSFDDKLIKSSNSLSKEDLIALREKYIYEYSKKKGWNSENLLPDQLLEIVDSNGFKNPGMLLS